jgi:hypothetical protein
MHLPFHPIDPSTPLPGAALGESYECERLGAR